MISRYEKMMYRRCGKSGVLLPRISLGLWQNFGEVNSQQTARELVLRVKKRLEKNGGAPAKNTYVLGPLQVDVSRHLVTVRGRSVVLTATEFKLLVLLLQRIGHEVNLVYG